MLPFASGPTPSLAVGGEFTTVGAGVPAARIATWNGTSWSALGSGLSFTVQALAAHDDGSGPGLHAAGGFLAAGGVAVRRIAKWDGASWAALGSGLNAGSAFALAVHDDGGCGCRSSDGGGANGTLALVFLALLVVRGRQSQHS